MIPVVAPEGEPSALPTADSYEWFTTNGRQRAPSWRNECTLRSVEMFLEYEPGTYLPCISPTPLLLVVAAGDHLTVSDLAIDAYERAREPKRLEILPGRPLRRLHRRTSSAPAARRATGSPSTCWPGSASQPSCSQLVQAVEEGGLRGVDALAGLRRG